MPKLRNNPGWILLTTLLVSMPVCADITGDAAPAVANASVEVAFTPGDDAAGKIVSAIGHARRQVLVQAYSFTHDGIAGALLEAHRRGVDVRLIADREQTEQTERGQVPGLARAGVPVWLDGEHQSAHNKVMVIDPGLPSALVITGSYNFTRAAQYKNAENVILVGNSDSLVQAYVRNWQRHLRHSQPLTIH
jgi:phosphatidylserine/phosphatidylglycerophosphate/cardiolipin synthase-like enzyme